MRIITIISTGAKRLSKPEKKGKNKFLSWRQIAKKIINDQKIKDEIRKDQKKHGELYN